MRKLEGALRLRSACNLSRTAAGPSRAVLAAAALVTAHLLFKCGGRVHPCLRRVTGAVLRGERGCLCGRGGATRAPAPASRALCRAVGHTCVP